jgi:AcrR family transcriptional regulator
LAKPSPALQPRKLPVQARSTASVDAILEATIQVLLDVGKEKLTTTRVASRAGVSVGTLYQYFPNKSAVTQVVERVCRDEKGGTLSRMATALINAFLEAKIRDAKASVTLYAVSSDVDGAKIVQQIAARSNNAVVAILASVYEPVIRDPQLMASMLQGAMAGISRRLLESDDPEKQFETFRQELILLAAC